MLGELNEIGEKVGLLINFGKSKILTNSKIPVKTIIKNKELESVTKIVYLRRLISLKSENEKEILRKNYTSLEK